MIAVSQAGRPATDAFAATVVTMLAFFRGLRQVATEMSSAGGLLVRPWCRWQGIPPFRRDRTLLSPHIFAALAPVAAGPYLVNRPVWRRALPG